MDIHRSRFVPYPTSAISALAFSRSSDSGFTGPLPALKLALGRANGNIEIWNPQRGSWVQETVFLGEGRGIDGLQWIQEPNDTDANGQIVPGQCRLFSIASSPAVTEWDLATGLTKRRSTGNFSEVWCFAAQPRWKPQKGAEEETRPQDIVAGCGDGTLVLLSTEDQDLQFKRFLARVGGKSARCMCITYQSRDLLVAGFADSMIRIYDTRNGSLVRSMSLGASVPGAPKNSLVWQVRCLPNGDIVSADSNGEVKFWDGKTYSQTQRISGHETDCLDLVTSSDGRMVFSGSIDGKLAVYRMSNDGGRKSWAKTNHRRVHSGEVKAMAAFDSKGLSVVVSGGSDATPVVTPLRTYGEENLRALPSLPQEPPIISAAKARLLISWWEKSISIWRIARNSGDHVKDEHQRPRKLVARIKLDTKHDIKSVTVTPDGSLLAAATSSETKLFHLRRRVEYDSLSIRKLKVPIDLATSGARLLTFSPDGNWLANVTAANDIFIARLTHDAKKAKHVRVLSKTVELERGNPKSPAASAFSQYDRTITRIAFAPDSSVLVVSDLSGYLDSWILEGEEDLTLQPVAPAKAGSSTGDSGSDSDSDSSEDDGAAVAFYGQRWTDNPSRHLLPKLESSPLVMMFRPTKDSSHAVALVNGHPDSHSNVQGVHAQPDQRANEKHRLWIITARHQMYEFDVLAGRLTAWSRRNPSVALPKDFSQIRDRVMGALWDVQGSRDRIWLYGSSFIFMLNLGVDLDSTEHLEANRKRKRKPNEGDDDDTHERRKRESGAGGQIHESRRKGINGDVTRSEDGTWTKVDLGHAHYTPLEADDDEDDDDHRLPLTTLESSKDKQIALNNAAYDSTTERRWWCTFKFRPILGMVPLQDGADIGSDKALEVVLVERTPWDSKSEQR